MHLQDEYPVLDEQASSVLPRRSALYNLEPIGLGTGARESLTSYAERLADAHCISPRMLADVPAAGEIARVKFNRGAALRARWFVTGGNTSLEWAQILGRLTDRSGLGALTLAPLARVVNERHLTSRRRRWCPQCLREAATSHVLYTQLLWDIDCVMACPFHRIELSAECSCRRIRAARRRVKWSPGHCPCCGQLLCETLPTREAHPQQVRLARTVRALLAEPRFDRGGWNASDDHSGAFFTSAAIRHFQGKPAHLARVLGLSKSALHGWMKGNHRPTLALLVGVADRTGCSVADILDGRADDARQPDGRIVRPRRNTSLRVTRTQREAITQQLASALCDSVPVPLLHVARRLEVNCDYLRDRYPQQSAAIVARFKAHQRKCAAAKRAGFSVALRARAEQLVAQGVWPTFQHLLSGLKPTDRYANLHAEVNLVLARARRRMARSHRLTNPLHRTTDLHQVVLEP